MEAASLLLGEKSETRTVNPVRQFTSGEFHQESIQSCMPYYSKHIQQRCWSQGSFRFLLHKIRSSRQGVGAKQVFRLILVSTNELKCNLIHYQMVEDCWMGVRNGKGHKWGRTQGYKQFKLTGTTCCDVALFGARCAWMLWKNQDLASGAYKGYFPMALFCLFFVLFWGFVPDMTEFTLPPW